MARKEPLPPSGFTAVNGDTMRHTSFRPRRRYPPTKKPVREPSPESTPRAARDDSDDRDSDNITVADRSRDNGNHRLDSDGGKKRKRDETPEDIPQEVVRSNRPSVAPEEGSPKRRLTHQLDPPVELASPDKAIQASYPVSIERPAAPEHRPYEMHSRNPSYVSPQQVRDDRQPSTASSAAKWSRGEPLPSPRPETVDGLAESLKRELDQHRNERPTTERIDLDMSENSASPESDGEGEGEAYRQLAAYSPDSQQNSNDDPKKRKRVFSNRTKTGCHTCRSRKKKCDEAKPICQNCERGGFQCGGYGAKPPQGFKPSVVTSRAPIALQSKPPYEPSHGPTGYYAHPSEDPYSHWARMPPGPPGQDHRSSSAVDQRHHGLIWQKSGWQSGEQLPTIPQLYGHNPEHTLPPPHHAPAPWPPAPPPPPPSTLTPYRHSTGPIIRGSESSSTSSSHRAAALSLNYISGNQPPHISEKDKMLLGFPFLHFLDEQLSNDRLQCKSAVERYNDAAKPSVYNSGEEQGRFFRAIVDPPFRPTYPAQRLHHEPYNGPKGYVGTCTVVEAPFHCEYGYNIHLGDDVVISRSCEMYDACEVRVGSRTIVGPNVKFYTTSAPMAPTSRKGTKGCLAGGGISVGEGCFIGGGVIILPFRKIGNGAVVGAGSVVTKDVKENTVVAGNPARFIRMVEPGPNVERHRPEIQEQNDKMLHEMRENARRGHDR